MNEFFKEFGGQLLALVAFAGRSNRAAGVLPGLGLAPISVRIDGGSGFAVYRRPRLVPKNMQNVL
jgi:hypothetical protein